MKENKCPLLSVSVITYQHGQFIKQCLDSILSQVTGFDFEIILGEDGSTDGTREICIEYAERFPEKIRLFLHEPDRNNPVKNVEPWMPNFLNNLRQAKGKYIALCDGDDYWTDPNKLQKQVDFLETHPDYAICFHSVKCLKNGVLSDIPFKKPPFETTTVLDLCKLCYIQTVSCVYRNGLIDQFPEAFNQSPVGDYFLFLLVAQYGKIFYFGEDMAVYRQHEGGVWSRYSPTEQAEKAAEVHDYLRKYFSGSIKEALTEEYLNRLESIAGYYKKEYTILNRQLVYYKSGVNNPYYIAENFQLYNIVKGFIYSLLRILNK